MDIPAAMSRKALPPTTPARRADRLHGGARDDDSRSAEPHAERVLAACRSILASERPPLLDALARAAGLSGFHFQRVFKRIVGVSPREYHAMERTRRLQQALANGDGVDDAIYGAGYGSPSRVYERSAALLGMTPALYRAGAPGLCIRHAVVRTELGWLMAAATERGLCAVEFGASRDELLALLKRRFSKAEIASADPALERWVARIVAFVARPAKPLALPLDLAGTAFQQRVWRALRAIPPGETLSYAALATRLGKPNATRAVASACARNPVALAVPCHRVVGSDGSLRGYRWGTDRKRELLAREQGATRRREKAASGS
ncbi:MAG: methylated-DNA--[protein]-cysteine S-methyltransferase [Betaproteobacteria bacterium]|nr:methylated-DNA--[protein]-cysteine S-methyltransferase [Betaproteobacteria bacterium]